MAARKSSANNGSSPQESKAAPAKGGRTAASEDDDAKPTGRAVWNGSISFGLLQIPVSLFTAESKSEIHFSQLDKNDHAPVGYKRINKVTGKEIAWGDIVRGYEYEKGQYVVITDEELKAANVAATETIDIQDFVEAKAIPAMFFETPYFIAPTKRSAKAYAVLRDALEAKGRAAVATFVMRSREHLAAIMVHGDALVLELLRYPYELKSTEQLVIPKKDDPSLHIHPREIAMAERLIDEMTDEWTPAKYKDSYRDDLLAKIEEKIQTGSVTAAHEPKREADGGTVIDIMSLLKRSLESRGGKKGASSDEEEEEAEEAEDGPKGGVKKVQPAKKAGKARAHSG